MLPPIEGFQDILRVNSEPPTRDAATALLATFQRRVDLIDNVLEGLAQTARALEALRNDGYPTLPTREVPDQVLADVDQNIATQQAARAFLKPEQAVSLGLQAGEAEEK